MSKQEGRQHARKKQKTDERKFEKMLHFHQGKRTESWIRGTEPLLRKGVNVECVQKTSMKC